MLHLLGNYGQPMRQNFTANIADFLYHFYRLFDLMLRSIGLERGENHCASSSEVPYYCDISTWEPTNCGSVIITSLES